MGRASNHADQRESPDTHRAQGAGILGGGNGEVSVRQWLGEAEGLRAEVSSRHGSGYATATLTVNAVSSGHGGGAG